MSEISLLAMPSGRARPLDKVPRLSMAQLRQAVLEAPSRERRVSALFGRPAGDKVELILVLSADQDGVVEVGRAEVEGRSFPSMTPDCPQVHLFERELAELWGLKPEGHPWLKPVRFQRPLRPGPDPFGRPEGSAPQVGVTNFFRVEGEEIHEVAVGPVHAGVIEPGHFRFQCHGEHVFHLEISLGYQHRGIERALLGSPRPLHLMECAAGDTTIGHASAYCQALEALGGAKVPARARALRGIALELERLANHTGDLGALAGDVGYLPTASFCGRLRGDFLNMTAHLCGNRFGRSLVVPGGVDFDVDEARIEQLLTRLEAAWRDVSGAVGLLWTSASVQARFEETGAVSTKIAGELGLVGPAARASGLRRDVRKTHPSGIFQFAHIPISLMHAGDVFSRAYVRALEIERSVAFIRNQLKELPKGPAKEKCPPPAPNLLCVSLVEGWRGEICHVALTGEDGKLASYKVVDPSFHNWTGLAMALRDQQISDFPLCNKSFNLSYCGYDL